MLSYNLNRFFFIIINQCPLFSRRHADDPVKLMFNLIMVGPDRFASRKMFQHIF